MEDKLRTLPQTLALDRRIRKILNKNDMFGRVDRRKPLLSKNTATSAAFTLPQIGIS